MDRGQKETEKILREVEKRIDKEYSQAIEEIEAELADYLRRFELKDKKWQEWVEDGTKTEEEYEKWRFGQLAVGKRWSEQKDAIAKELFKVNEEAKKTYKSSASEIFAENVNFATYELERDAKINTSFTLYSKDSVDRLIEEDPDVLPAPGKKVSRDIAEGKAIRWNRQQLQSVMIQGILQGDSIPKLATRLANTVGDRNRKAAIRNARTMATGAQNAGRVDAYKRAESKGVEMEQMWLATHDSRTRHSHRWMDGEHRPVGEEFSNGCMFPGDPNGPAAEIYNCRCTLRGVVKGLERRAYKYMDPSGMDGMSYDEWRNAKATSNRITLPEDKANNIKQSYLAEYRRPHNENGTMNRVEYVPINEYQAVTKRLEKELDNYGLRESKWNGEIKTIPKYGANVARTTKNNGIEISEKSCEGTMVHELLHLRSEAYAPKGSYPDFRNIEEATVQLLTEAVCEEKGYAYAYTYQEMVESLRTIRLAIPEYKNDMDFGCDLINQDMTTRYGWLYNKIDAKDRTEEIERAFSMLSGGDLGL